MISTLMNQNKNRVNYRFPFWLTVIFLLLILIPCAILTQYILVAKLSGILCLLVVIIAMRFWFRAAKLNSDVKDRVILNNNDWFDLGRTYPSLYKWNKREVSILKDRIGLMLSNTEIRNKSDELCSRMEAIEIAFQFCVYNWEENLIRTGNTCVYIGEDSRLYIKNIENDQVLIHLSLGFTQSFESIKELQSYYRSINENA
jgi:hypothetical protein